ncbi:methyltransferase, TIGR04325 family [Parapedobacter indicus]|uniref:Putative methyltransferase, LIC12133 family n=1 Tax=Parapedobacter indicus TaxID=1477437 RepID=A0A1I3PPC9_9SPHI|nr:methyltransferase, TIGR04325 family [Parapedobacter indicus]PPL00520.1 putative methyltransferase (TIGR04325 family) [Parapedobacter indicus]SFJ23167.1 putative methyltransferase, LIC12133 family [Parapedobacter indicus]
MKVFSKKKKNITPPLPLYGWFGDYSSWEDASCETGGYHQANILKKTRNALLKIRDREAIYERDSVLFDKKEYPFPIIACLLHIAAKRENTLRVIDFGGSLGSTYFQLKDFLSPLNTLRWHVVEQPMYIEAGRQDFENEQLKFYHTIVESMAIEQPDVILLSSVVQYLAKPHDFLSELVKYEVEYLLFDRTAFISNGHDRLTIQRVPPEIYDASYPSWFFNEMQFMEHFSHYTLVADFTSYVASEADLYIDGQLAGYDKGFLLQKNAL